MIEKEQESFINWDFKEAETKQFTHGYHTYPAMMIPQIARRLIYLYGKNAKTLLDPFCGSGTSIVEASLTPQIKEAFGFDLNPLAVLIAKVKTTPLDTAELGRILDKLLVAQGHNGVPDFKNIEFWFKPQVTERLATLKTAINKIKNKDVKDFFLVAFSETVRNVSNTRNGEFKLYRMAEKSLEKHNPWVFKEFEKIVLKNIHGMKEYNKARHKTKTTATLGSSMLDLPLKPQSINLIVTSPPYGDSRTTVAYGQFSRLALQWLDYEDVASLDNRLMGGKASKELEVKINSPTLKSIIKEIAEKDEKRAREVLSFYDDFDQCVDQLNKAMAKDGYVCFVVGNRTVKGVNIPTDKIMAEMFKAKADYEHITTHLRNIPNKRMPSLNSPTNKVGEKVTTMCNEFIFVLRKN
ncbi:MAG: DNA methyltransferase [Nanoarchaeota archaeon]|nr:DNA methyltransferase [Nanoarchaeota archaeon]